MAKKIIVTDSLVRRFWSKVKRGRGCWLWTACRYANGYGRIGLGGKEAGVGYAHRVSYTIHRSDPGEEQVCHTCDNPQCVRPSHLFVGTQKDNMRDAVKKGRLDGRSTSFGEAHGLSTLTDEEVADIRWASGLQREIAASYGVSQVTVSRIKRGIVRNRGTGIFKP